jgi:hypothetical protein
VSISGVLCDRMKLEFDLLSRAETESRSDDESQPATWMSELSGTTLQPICGLLRCIRLGFTKTSNPISGSSVIRRNRLTFIHPILTRPPSHYPHLVSTMSFRFAARAARSIRPAAVVGKAPAVARRAASSGGEHKKPGSDLPWIVGSAVFFIPVVSGDAEEPDQRLLPAIHGFLRTPVQQYRRPVPSLTPDWL